MRILLVHPGPSYSTHDVWEGLRGGLRSLGHTVFEYEISGHARASADALKKLHEATGDPPPTRNEVLYHAGHAVYTMCLRHAIEAVIIVTAEHWHPDHTILLRRAGIPVGIVFTESPYQDEVHACNMGLATHVWTNDKSSVEVLAEAFALLEAPAQAFYLPVGYDGSKVAAAEWNTRVPAHDVVFVGTGFAERIALLESVDWSGIDLGLYGQWGLLIPRWVRRACNVFNGEAYSVAGWKAVSSLLPGGSPLWRHIQGGIISNDLALELYRRASIGINMFRSSAVYGSLETPTGYEAYSLSPRVYELAASGTFIISEYRPELEEVFGDLVPTFRSPEELESLIRYWLPRDKDRAEISDRLIEVASGHSYRRRAEQLIEDLARRQS